MKCLNGNFYVEVEDNQYRIHPTENIMLRPREEPKNLGTQYQIQNETEIRKNQKVIKSSKDHLVGKNCPKNKQPIIQQRNNSLTFMSHL